MRKRPTVKTLKRSPIRSKPKTVRKRRMVLALDKACRREVVEARDWNTCQRCGHVQGAWIGPVIDPRRVVIQWAHVHTREYYITRWEPDNSLALCDACHVWFDNHKVLSYEWFRKHWPERWERIQNVLRVSTKTSEAWIRAKYQALREFASKEQIAHNHPINTLCDWECPLWEGPIASKEAPRK